MALYLLIIFILVPLIEIGLFIEVGGRLGAAPTVAIVILTAIIGTGLLRRQGLMVLRRTQDSLNQGRMPMTEVFDGLCLLVAGALLLTPGFMTDAIGFLLFVPPLRRWLGTAALKRMIVRRAPPGNGAPGPNIIEGEFREITPDQDQDNSPGNGGGAP